MTNYISELGKPFEKRAANKKFADWVNLDKSMVRLTNPYNIKIGGGARVKKVQISDDWDQMVSGATAAAYDRSIIRSGIMPAILLRLPGSLLMSHKLETRESF